MLESFYIIFLFKEFALEHVAFYCEKWSSVLPWNTYKYPLIQNSHLSQLK